jgi:hypothetical protein
VYICRLMTITVFRRRMSKCDLELLKVLSRSPELKDTVRKSERKAVTRAGHTVAPHRRQTFQHSLLLNLSLALHCSLPLIA